MADAPVETVVGNLVAAFGCQAVVAEILVVGVVGCSVSIHTVVVVPISYTLPDYVTLDDSKGYKFSTCVSITYGGEFGCHSVYRCKITNVRMQNSLLCPICGRTYAVAGRMYQGWAR